MPVVGATLRGKEDGWQEGGKAGLAGSHAFLCSFVCLFLPQTYP